MPFTFDSDTPFETRRLGPDGEPLYRNGGHGQSPRPGDVQPLPPMPLIRSALAVVQRAVASGDTRRAAFAAHAACRFVRWERERATSPPADLVRVELVTPPLAPTDGLYFAEQAAAAGREAVLAATRKLPALPEPFAAEDVAYAAAYEAAHFLRLAAPSLFQPADAAGED